MTNHGDAIDPQQRGTAEFSVIDPPLEILQWARDQRIGQPPPKRPPDFLQQQLANRLGNAFGNFQRDISDKSVTDHDIREAAVHLAPFDVADEIQRARLQQLKGFLRHFVALAVFFTDAQQTNAGIGLIKQMLAIFVAHHGKLLKILGTAIEAELRKQIYRLEDLEIQREQAEESVERLYHQNELVLNAAGEGIFGLDMQGKHTFVNPAAAQMLGYTVHELIGRHSHTLWHYKKSDGSSYPVEECPIYAAYKDGSVHHKDEEVFWRKNGTCFPVAYTSTPIIEDGNIIGAVVTFRDITERKQAEEEFKKLSDELARSNADLQQFAYTASHDLQEPMMVVAGFVKLLAKRYKGKLDEKADEFIEHAIDGD